MSYEQLLAEIKSRGYWRVEMHSTHYRENKLSSRAAMQALMGSATVSLRGRPYPYFYAPETVYNGKWLEGKVNKSYQKEYWRLYKSGQWIHYLGLEGAWIPRESIFEGRSPLPSKHAGYMHVRGHILFTLTEILRFAVGLANSALSPTAFLSIELHNTSDYMLFENFERPFFSFQAFVNPSDRPIEQKKSAHVSQLAAEADQIALEIAIEIYSVFGWIPTDAAIRMLAEDQKELIERKL
jgi:hypothetical protein